VSNNLFPTQLKAFKARLGEAVAEDRYDGLRMDAPVRTDSKYVTAADKWIGKHKKLLSNLARVAANAAEAGDPADTLLKGLKADSKLANEIQDLEPRFLWDCIRECTQLPKPRLKEFLTKVLVPLGK
jgi:hypothetical protein